MSNEKRRYNKKRRADLEAQTRLCITESAVELHGTIGPSRTSISEVARHAGVRRSTVYRHFPDEAALFAACSAHWITANPPPDITAWMAISDPEERLATALWEVYDYYERNERMLANLHRDEGTMEVVKRVFQPFHAFLAAARDVLAAGNYSRKETRAAIGHSLAFSTWRSLVREQGLDGREAARMMSLFISAADQGGARHEHKRPSDAVSSSERRPV